MAVALNEASNYGIYVPDYLDENVRTKVVKMIQSYVSVVDEMMWIISRIKLKGYFLVFSGVEEWRDFAGWCRN